MSFASPPWLIGLLPWTAVTMWLFTGRRNRAQVPFLHLWKGPDATPPRARAAIEIPPPAILCAIFAMLLAIFGAAKPQLVFNESADHPSQTPVTQPSSNIEIITASASVSPKPQVMVRVRNDSDAGKASLKITSAGDETTASIDLPPRGQERNYFIDLDSVDATIAIELADHRASLSLVHSPPMLESRGDLPPQMQRIIATYSKLKPASSGSARIIVTADKIAPDQPAVILAPADLAQSATAPHIIDHPINAHVNWSAVLKQDIQISSTAPPGSDWQTVLSLNDHPALAVRESPVRQVWVGFTSDSFPRTSEFVIFWTNVFDWIGQVQNESQYAFQGASTASIPTTTPTNWQTSGHVRDMTSAFLMGSVAIIFVAAMAWATCKNCA